MRQVHVEEIRTVVRDLCIQTNCRLAPEVVDTYKRALIAERHPRARSILEQMIANAEIACAHCIATCQDTGFGVVFLDIGQGVELVGGDLKEAVDCGVGDGYTAGYLRPSMVSDPVTHDKNTGDNMPSVLYTSIVPGEAVRIRVMAKGGGGENGSQIRMMVPADGEEGIVQFAVEVVRKAGVSSCAPFFVGVGVGGTFEAAALIAKKALLRPVGSPSSDPKLAAMEERIMRLANATGIGPMGLGGDTTVLSVAVDTLPTHIGCLPVAVNLNCHVHRVGEKII